MDSTELAQPAQAGTFNLLAAEDVAQLERGDALVRRGAGDIVTGCWLIGDALNRLKDAIPHGQWEAYLEGRSYSERSARRWMRMARTAPLEKVVAYRTWAEAEAALLGVVRQPQLARHGSDGTRDKGGQRWYTPEAIVEAVRVALGGVIELDPASSADANAVVKAERFLDEEADGLAASWGGARTVFLNPPWATADKAAFVAKLAAAYRWGSPCGLAPVKHAVLLTAADYSAAWYEPIRQHVTATCALRGRVKFWGPDADRHPMGSTLHYLGLEPERFGRAVGHLGDVGYASVPALHVYRWLADESHPWHERQALAEEPYEYDFGDVGDQVRFVAEDDYRSHLAAQAKRGDTTARERLQSMEAA